MDTNLEKEWYKAFFFFFFFFWRFSLVLMALCAISQRNNFIFIGWRPFHIGSVRFIASTFSPMSIIKDFVEKTPSMLGSQISGSALFDKTTGVRSRLNSVHSLLHYPLNFYQASNSKICWQHFTFFYRPFLLCESLYKNGYFRASVVFSIYGSVQNDVLPPSPTLWKVRLVMRFCCFLVYFPGSFVEDGGVDFCLK